MRFSTGWTSISSITSHYTTEVEDREREKAKQMEIRGNAAGPIQTGWPAGTALSPPSIRGLAWSRTTAVGAGTLLTQLKRLPCCLRPLRSCPRKSSVIHFLICWFSCDIVIFQIKILLIIYFNQEDQGAHWCFPLCQRFRKFRSEFKWKSSFRFFLTRIFGITSGGGPHVSVGTDRYSPFYFWQSGSLL